MATVYIETSLVSYLRHRPSSGIVMGARQLLTWNCRHIANARILPRIYHVLADMNIPIPMICTPEELLGDETETET